MKRLASWPYFAIALLLVSGCATNAQLQANAIDLAFQDALAKLSACEQEYVSSPEAVSAVAKYIVVPNDPDAFSKMSNSAFATDRDKEILLALMAREAPCRGIAIQEFFKSHPAFGVSFANLYAQRDRDAASLMRGEITIGAFNDTFAVRIQETTRDIQAIFAQINQNLMAAQQNELQQWAVLASALESWSYQTNALAQQSRTVRIVQEPTRTYCQVIGQSVRCRTR